MRLYQIIKDCSQFNDETFSIHYHVYTYTSPIYWAQFQKQKQFKKKTLTHVLLTIRQKKSHSHIYLFTLLSKTIFINLILFSCPDTSMVAWSRLPYVFKLFYFGSIYFIVLFNNVLHGDNELEPWLLSAMNIGIYVARRLRSHPILQGTGYITGQKQRSNKITDFSRARRQLPDSLTCKGPESIEISSNLHCID